MERLLGLIVTMRVMLIFPRCAQPVSPRVWLRDLPGASNSITKKTPVDLTIGNRIEEFVFLRHVRHFADSCISQIKCSLRLLFVGLGFAQPLIKKRLDDGFCFAVGKNRSIF